MLDGCVTEFGMRSAELRAHRQALRSAADELGRAGVPDVKAAHEGGHSSILKTRSSRPFAHRLDAAALPPVD